MTAAVDGCSRQVLLNWRRQSTIGWNIWNVLLDFMGGSLSVAQLMIDSG